jgi:hypothetical protein
MSDDPNDQSQKPPDQQNQDPSRKRPFEQWSQPPPPGYGEPPPPGYQQPPPGYQQPPQGYQQPPGYQPGQPPAPYEKQGPFSQNKTQSDSNSGVWGWVIFILIFGVGNLILYNTTGWLIIPIPRR